MKKGRGESPGKLIISGEHSVVYGKPALVVAVNRFAFTKIEATNDSVSSFVFHNGNKKTTLAYTPEALTDLFNRLNAQYRKFTEGKLLIRNVMNDPLELIPFAFCSISQKLQKPFHGRIILNTEVDIPIGCGMGSSAAISLSVLKAAASYFNIETTADELFDHAMACEKLQHGAPSGVDPYICLHGGCIQYCQQKMKPLPLPDLSFHVVLTGTPKSSTGECVMKVKERFGDSDIWGDFEAATLRMTKTILSRDSETLHHCVRENHSLLTAIGVVPGKVCEFISQIENNKGSAKISGAGSVIGEAAGAVIVFADQAPVELCRQFNYDLITLQTLE